jgi:hypothetical protein
MMLSILICTIPERVELLTRLKNVLEPQVKRHQDLVEIKIHDAGRSMSTGDKRNQLVANCEGEYFSFIDDDDLVPMYYVDEILKAIISKPDVVTFIGYMTTNGKDRRDFTIKLGSRYEEKNGHYYRFPNHLCVFKKSLVSHIKFPSVYVQEDYQWAREIHDRRLLKTEVHIDKSLYHYDFRTSKPPYARAR